MNTLDYLKSTMITQGWGSQQIMKIQFIYLAMKKLNGGWMFYLNTHLIVQ